MQNVRTQATDLTTDLRKLQELLDGLPTFGSGVILPRTGLNKVPGEQQEVCGKLTIKMIPFNLQWFDFM